MDVFEKTGRLPFEDQRGMDFKEQIKETRQKKNAFPESHAYVDGFLFFQGERTMLLFLEGFSR